MHDDTKRETQGAQIHEPVPQKYDTDREHPYMNRLFKLAFPQTSAFPGFPQLPRIHMPAISSWGAESARKQTGWSCVGKMS